MEMRLGFDSGYADHIGSVNVRDTMSVRETEI